jgi:hypothetical protein
MFQNEVDFFAAMGLGLTRLLLVGLSQNATWFWSILAGAGLIWSIGIAAFDDEGIVLVVKQMICVLLSAICFWGYVKVDLAQYSYTAPGKLEAQFNNSQGAALVPTYGVFVVSRQLTIDVRGVIAKGQTSSIPNVVAKADMLTTEPETLDDSQLKANLAIWNQIVAPYLLKQNAALEKSLNDAGVLGEFMVPTLTSTDFMGAHGTNATQVQTILSQTSVDIGNMLCSLAPMIDSMATKMGAASWTSSTGACTDTSINLNMVASAKKADTMPTIFSHPPQAAWNLGQAMTQAMTANLGNGTDVQAVSSISDLYQKLGQSILFVAGNRYASDSDKVILLGTACDKMSTSDAPNACYATQMGLAGAARGLVAATSYKGPEDKSGVLSRIGTGLAFVGGWGTTSVFRALMAVLSSIVQTVIPYAIGILTGCSLLVSFIGIFVLLWPRRLASACEWMVGPIMFVSLWSALNGIWTELDTWIMAAVSMIGSVISADRMMGSNVTSILVSIGYLAMPFFAWNVLFGSASKALSKTTNFAQRMVEAGAALAIWSAGKGIGAMEKMDRGGQSSRAPGGGGDSGGGAGGGGGNAAGGPPSSTPASSIGGSGARANSSAGSNAGPAANSAPSSASGRGGIASGNGQSSSSLSSGGRSAVGSAAAGPAGNSFPSDSAGSSGPFTPISSQSGRGAANSGGPANSTPSNAPGNDNGRQGNSGHPGGQSTAPVFTPIPPK